MKTTRFTFQYNMQDSRDIFYMTRERAVSLQLKRHALITPTSLQDIRAEVEGYEIPPRSGFAEVSLSYRRVSKCHSRILLEPSLQSASVLTFTKLASVRLPSCSKCFTSRMHFTLMYLDMRNQNVPRTAPALCATRADLFILQLPVWDDRVGIFSFCVVASARL